MSDNMRVTWRHPVLGHISEDVCSMHRDDLMYALRALGIGAAVTPAWRHRCDRCEIGDMPIREWLETVADLSGTTT